MTSPVYTRPFALRKRNSLFELLFFCVRFLNRCPSPLCDQSGSVVSPTFSMDRLALTERERTSSDKAEVYRTALQVEFCKHLVSLLCHATTAFSKPASAQLWYTTLAHTYLSKSNLLHSILQPKCGEQDHRVSSIQLSKLDGPERREIMKERGDGAIIVVNGKLVSCSHGQHMDNTRHTHTAPTPHEPHRNRSCRRRYYQTLRGPGQSCRGTSGHRC